jgi:hypothetical protein
MHRFYDVLWHCFLAQVDAAHPLLSDVIAFCFLPFTPLCSS